MRTLEWSEPKDGDVIATWNVRIFSKREWVRCPENVTYGFKIFSSFIICLSLIGIFGSNYVEHVGIFFIFTPKLFDLLFASLLVFYIIN